MPRCNGLKADQTPCQRLVGASQDYCYSHDPARERASPLNPDEQEAIAEIKRLKRQLRGIVAGVVDKKIGTRPGDVAIKAINAQLRAIAVEREVRDDAELEHRLDALEEQLGRESWGAAR